MRPRSTIALAAALLAGCGLVIDVSPPDPLVRLDAGARDAGGTLDAGALDAGTPDGGTLDAGTLDAGAPDGGTLDPCEGIPEGAPCGEDPARLCSAGRCVLSRCGDGFVDPGAGEECDDGNEAPGDGCEPFVCLPSCRLDTDCPVTGNECAPAVCSGSRCTRAAVPDGEACTTPLGDFGTCEGGICRSPLCGDGIPAAGEECDDGNAIPNDGCEPDCSITCSGDLDCADGSFCNGAERCASISGGDGRSCEPGEPLVAPECFACSEVTGAFVRIDADGDGYSPGACAGGGDCDDSDASRHPGARDPASPPNGIDDDCDGLVDEDVVVQCWRDADHDGFGSRTTVMTAPDDGCPAGWVPAAADTSIRSSDCNDANADVFPGQTAWFDVPACPPGAPPPCFDYDCDGADEVRWGAFTCRTVDGRCEGQGFAGPTPGCGALGTLSTCASSVFGGACTSASTTVRQQCH